MKKFFGVEKMGLRNAMQMVTRGVAVATFAFFLVGATDTGMSSPFERDVASLGFPTYESTSDEGEILGDYPAYLNFVLEIGKNIDHSTASRLAQTYVKLRKKSPVGAARFLKGLRFEMITKLELMGASPQNINTQTPEIRRWVGRYIKEWLREADEHLFRAYAYNAELALSQRN